MEGRESLCPVQISATKIICGGIFLCERSTDCELYAKYYRGTGSWSARSSDRSTNQPKQQANPHQSAHKHTS